MSKWSASSVRNLLRGLPKSTSKATPEDVAKAAVKEAPKSPAIALPKAREVDIMLLLEGTFPYVAGGVSSWVNQIIRGFPEYKFGVCFVGSRPQDYGEMKYQLPDNVVHIELHYMHGGAGRPPIAAKPKSAKKIASMEALHQYFRGNRLRRKGQLDKNGVAKPGTELAGCPFSEKAMSRVALEAGLAEIERGGLMSLAEFLYGESAWSYISEHNRKFCSDPSFVDYFWTVRTMHAPIWVLADIAKNLIPAKAYHTISTGYAGFLGALLKRRTGRPLLLSEHGIYTKERKIDLFQSDWIKDNRGVLERDPSQLGYFRDLWIRFFEALGVACYDQANKVVALYENNRLRQVADGADSSRTMNIPNGINLQRLSALRDKRPKEIPQVLCLIGRVVPIKDIETFVRAMRTVVNKLPNAEAWIAGPEDEDLAYAEGCKTLAKNLGLADKVKFLGFQKIEDILPKIGLGILSSVSEALPLVVLEGYAAGVPVVSTDVGSCKQLVYGLGPEDQAIGPSGRIVRIADAEGLALAAVELLSDPEKWYAAQAAGIKRVQKYYTQELMFGSYRTLYQRAVAGWPDEVLPKAAPDKDAPRQDVSINPMPAKTVVSNHAPAKSTKPTKAVLA